MPDTITAAGPVVRMCGDPACHGAEDCPSALRDRQRVTDRTIGMSDSVPSGMPDDAMLAVLTRELALGRARDSRSTFRLIPDGCELTVHRSASLAGAPWTAIYSGPATCIDDILGDAPEWPGDDFGPVQGVVTARLAAMREAGVLAPLVRWQAQVAARQEAARCHG